MNTCSRNAIVGMLALVGILGCARKTAPASRDTAAPAAATVGGRTDNAAVTASLDSVRTLYGAALERRDSSQILTVFDDSAAFMPPNAAAGRGRAGIANVFRGILTGTQSLRVSHHPMDVTIAGDYAIETGAFGLSWQRTGAKIVSDSGKYMMVWKEEPDGNFKIYRDIFNSDRPPSR